MSADELSRAVELLTRQVGHWELPRWVAPAKSAAFAGPEGFVTRAELVHGLVQRIADLAADAEGQPRRPVPQLDNDGALPDQLWVVAADLIAAEPPPTTLAAAAADVLEARRDL